MTNLQHDLDLCSVSAGSFLFLNGSCHSEETVSWKLALHPTKYWGLQHLDTAVGSWSLRSMLIMSATRSARLLDNWTISCTLSFPWFYMKPDEPQFSPHPFHSLLSLPQCFLDHQWLTESLLWLVTSWNISFLFAVP